MHHWAPPPSQSDSRIVRTALQYISFSDSTGAPPILTLNHLAQLSGCHYPKLRDVVIRSRKCYTNFKIRKRRGGFREISVPDHDLLVVQKWIHENVLSIFPVHSRAFAYVKGRSAIDMARLHAGCRWLIKIDLENFFGNISEKHVYKVFRALGYNNLLSFELARICTYVPVSYSATDFGQVYSISGYQPGPLGVLPQGAPTSPALSNLVARELDVRLTSVSARYGIVYSRYADDLAFSTRARIGRGVVLDFLRTVRSEIERFPFRVNDEKTSVLGPGSRRILLGLLVDTEQPRLTRGFLNRVEMHLYYAEKWGIAGHAMKRGFDDPVGLYRYLEGLVSYIRSVDSERGDCLQARLRSLRSS